MYFSLELLSKSIAEKTIKCQSVIITKIQCENTSLLSKVFDSDYVVCDGSTSVLKIVSSITLSIYL